MGRQRTSFDKRQRDRAKKAKAAAKQEARQQRASDRSAGVTPDEDTGLETEPLSPAELLARVETIHRQLEAGQITLEDFEEQRENLSARLPLD